MNIKKDVKLFLSIASFMMALAIAIGAFGAHGLKSFVEPKLLITYNTGVEYHFYNTLGLFAASFIIYLKPNSKKAVLASWLIFIGMIKSILFVSESIKLILTFNPTFSLSVIGL